MRAALATLLSVLLVAGPASAARSPGSGAGETRVRGSECQVLVLVPARAVSARGTASGKTLFADERTSESAFWLQPDRAGNVDGPNRYSYVRGNPIQNADPFGLKALVLAGLIGPVKDSAGRLKGTIDDDNFDSFKRALKRHLVRDSTFLKSANRSDSNVAVITYRGGEVTTLPSGWSRSDIDEILYVGHADLTGPDILPGESAVSAGSFLQHISSFEALRNLKIYACGAERTGESFVSSVKGFVESRFNVYGPQDTVTLDANFGPGGEVLSTWLSLSEREFLHYPAGRLVNP